MIKREGDNVHFDINNADVEKSMALLIDMRAYMRTLPGIDGYKETYDALTTAIEVMAVFWCEKFTEDKGRGTQTEHITSIADELKKARKKAGITQQQLADRLGCSAANYAQYEAGKRNPKPDTLKRIAEAIGIEANRIMEARQKRFGETLRTYRKRNGLTQIVLAESAGVNVQTIRSYEADKYLPGMKTLKKIAKALGCDPAELLGSDAFASEEVEEDL